MQTNIPAYCGNSPKMQLIVDFNLAFAKASTAEVLEYLHPDIHWEMIGDKLLEGHDAIAAFITKNANLQVKSWTITSVLSHGKLAACQGSMEIGRQTIHFADFYEFASHAAKAKIISIKTLAIG